VRNLIYRPQDTVLVQPEMERRRSPLVSIPPFGRGFSALRKNPTKCNPERPMVTSTPCDSGSWRRSMAISNCCYVAEEAIRICATCFSRLGALRPQRRNWSHSSSPRRIGALSDFGFLVQSLNAISLGSYLVGRVLIVRQYLRPSCLARPVYHLVARVSLAPLNSADLSKSQLPPLARIGHHYNVGTREILGCRVREVAFWQPFQEI
jgi:hypothetical protein